MGEEQYTPLEGETNIAELSKKGYQYIKANRLTEAEENFNRILVIDPRNTYALVGLGDAARKRGAFTQAIEYYETCLQYTRTTTMPFSAWPTVSKR